jgi:hypothetical protein
VELLQVPARCAQQRMHAAASKTGPSRTFPPFLSSGFWVMVYRRALMWRARAFTPRMLSVVAYIFRAVAHQMRCDRSYILYSHSDIGLLLLSPG